jgi:hypothetical protein
MRSWRRAKTAPRPAPAAMARTERGPPVARDLLHAVDRGDDGHRREHHAGHIDRSGIGVAELGQDPGRSATSTSISGVEREHGAPPERTQQQPAHNWPKRSTGRERGHHGPECLRALHLVGEHVEHERHRRRDERHVGDALQRPSGDRATRAERAPSADEAAARARGRRLIASVSARASVMADRERRLPSVTLALGLRGGSHLGGAAQHLLAERRSQVDHVQPDSCLVDEPPAPEDWPAASEATISGLVQPSPCPRTRPKTSANRPVAASPTPGTSRGVLRAGGLRFEAG